MVIDNEVKFEQGCCRKSVGGGAEALGSLVLHRGYKVLRVDSFAFTCRSDVAPVKHQFGRLVAGREQCRFLLVLAPQRNEQLVLVVRFAAVVERLFTVQAKYAFVLTLRPV